MSTEKPQSAGSASASNSNGTGAGGADHHAPMVGLVAENQAAARPPNNAPTPSAASTAAIIPSMLSSPPADAAADEAAAPAPALISDSAAATAAATAAAIPSDADAFTDFLENSNEAAAGKRTPMEGITESAQSASRRNGGTHVPPPMKGNDKGNDSEYTYVVVDMPLFQGTQFLNSVQKFEVKGLGKAEEDPKIIADGFPMRCQRIDTFGTNLIFEIGSVGPAVPVGQSTETIRCELDTRKIAERKIVNQ